MPHNLIEKKNLRIFLNVCQYPKHFIIERNNQLFYVMNNEGYEFLTFFNIFLMSFCVFYVFLQKFESFMLLHYKWKRKRINQYRFLFK